MFRANDMMRDMYKWLAGLSVEPILSTSFIEQTAVGPRPVPFLPGISIKAFFVACYERIFPAEPLSHTESLHDLVSVLVGSKGLVKDRTMIGLLVLGPQWK